MASNVFKIFLFWFDLVTYFLTPHDPVSKVTQILWRTSFWANLKIIGLKMWPQEYSIVFSLTWSGDLLFDPTWPSFELVGEIVEDIILSKFEVDQAENVASRVLQGFSMIWSCDLLFDQTWPSFKLDRDFVKDIILGKFDVGWAENVTTRVFTRFDLVTYFLTLNDLV